jgi:hypothetical protein
MFNNVTVWGVSSALQGTGCNYANFLVTSRTTVSLPNGATAPSGPGPSHYRGFTITLRHTTHIRTPLDE